MADERYQWLDQEAAERLLRGEPVDPVDDASRAQAELLARALDTARTPTAAAMDGELPGEAAALAAFRKAVAERATAATAAAPGSAGRSAPADLGAVRIAPVLTGRRWGRSLRYGIAAALAAVTVGGVAVAAGTGMLPLTSEPAPGRSVTAADTTAPTVSGSPGDGTGDGTDVPGVPADRDGRTGTPGPTDGPSTTAPGPGDTAGATTGPDGGTAGPDQGGALRDKRIVEACKDYRAGRLTDSGRQRIAGSLRSGETVKRYCERVLAGAPSTGATQPPVSTGRTSGTSGVPGGSPGSGSGSGSGSGGTESGDADGDDKDDRGDRNREGGAGGSRGGAEGAGGGPEGAGTHGKDRSRS
ncbi:hypothetical protein ABZ135_24030 [Streptomyces sp. NPDC006339]|uniref:hypothetical protein n=1 Tax=Streptomyces sp. NPDC006339 TaxID=3156755 RepID=UPI0033AA30F9